MFIAKVKLEIQHRDCTKNPILCFSFILFVPSYRKGRDVFRKMSQTLFPSK